MAMGLPVVASRVGGIPEEVGAEAALLVEPGDVDGTAAAIVRLVDSPQLRRQLGAAARGRVAAQFTLDRQAEGLGRAYQAAIGCDRG
jgi:glycosyltransferase involved in cell wall biosynthesis